MMCFYGLWAFSVLERAEMQKILTEQTEKGEISKISSFWLLHTEFCTHFYLSFEQFDSILEVFSN